MINVCRVIGIIIVMLTLGCNSYKDVNGHSHRDSKVHNNKTHSHQVELGARLDNYFGAYTLKDEDFGTNTVVTLNGGVRTMITNALPNHETGKFPGPGNPNTISAQRKTYTFPTTPKYTGNARWIREPGVAINGVKFEPGTAEVVACDTGENYRVEAFQELINLGLDFNNAHVQPTGAYHYHGTPTSVIEKYDSGEDLVHVGFAHDGFPMYYSKSGAYKPSYKLVDGTREGEDCIYETRRKSRDISVGGHHDGTYTSDFEYVSGSGDLDECNGVTIDGDYVYFVTDEFPYVSRCLMGEFTITERRGRPTVAQLFTRMDSNKDGKLSKDELRGPLASQFHELDKNDDGFLVESEIQEMQRANRLERSRW